MQSTNVSFRLVDPKTEMRDTKSKLELKIKAPMQLKARKFHFQLFRGNQVTRKKSERTKKLLRSRSRWKRRSQQISFFSNFCLILFFYRTKNHRPTFPLPVRIHFFNPKKLLRIFSPVRFGIGIASLRCF